MFSLQLPWWHCIVLCNLSSSDVCLWTHQYEEITIMTKRLLQFMRSWNILYLCAHAATAWSCGSVAKFKHLTLLERFWCDTARSHYGLCMCQNRDDFLPTLTCTLWHGVLRFHSTPRKWNLSIPWFSLLIFALECKQEEHMQSHIPRMLWCHSLPVSAGGAVVTKLGTVLF